MIKKALITGISGQDSSFLAELLLEKGYEVYGLKRRTSMPLLNRLSTNVLNRITILDGDMLDSSSLNRAVKSSAPDEVYNLAAQSFVKTSFDQPELTGEVTGLGVTRLLESIRQNAPDAKFYQASTSEMFGGHPPPQSDDTPFYPRSPYGVAKLYAHWMTVNYREAYNMFACCGILFNHETVLGNTPIVFKEGLNGKINIKPISEVVNHHCSEKQIVDETRKEYQQGPVTREIYIWDKSGWTRVKFASGYPHKGDKKPKIINSRAGCFGATSSHVVIMEDGSEKTVGDMEKGDKVSLCAYPKKSRQVKKYTEDEAFFLGMIVGDGCLSRGDFRFINKDEKLHLSMIGLWTKIGGEKTTRAHGCKSGFTGEPIGHTFLYGRSDLCQSDIYNEDRTKRVPVGILNGSIDIQMAFLHGYYEADGLKSGPAHTYEFTNFKTNSPTLASGLLFLLENCTKQTYNITVEEKDWNGRQCFYYSVNLHSNSTSPQNQRNSIKKEEEVLELVMAGEPSRKINRMTGISRTFIKKVRRGRSVRPHHRLLPNNEVKKIIDIKNYDGWFYDLETESGTFHCGVGQSHVHNSPRRGSEFVTQKIAQGVASIKLGYTDNIELGNLEAKRDWGHAKDFVRAMYLMLQQPKPEDFVIATGEAHTVKEFCEIAFDRVGMKWEDHVSINEKYMRPSEVSYLLGDCSKAKKALGWKPEIGFDQLVAEMVDYAVANPEEWRKVPEHAEK